MTKSFFYSPEAPSLRGLSAKQTGGVKLRSQTVGAAEQELGVLDGLAAEQHGQTIDAQTEAAVRGAAVLEELQIELDTIGQALLHCLSL